ncbi:hypothetical protein SPI_04112 [Niveomyces insectorum RCEF 264]|uniref:Cyclin-like protein n=1 Tax=Niveomyces insectorum RCEF 264 TaxID=1081102 RepID=A0A162J1T7_9HYPO|nr:hypothetical protein SPI_04112 [Niveomyces insectorum RCEF 264]
MASATAVPPTEPVAMDVPAKLVDLGAVAAAAAAAAVASSTAAAEAAAAAADELDEETYFATSYYRPLSNLPTPPPSSRNSSVLNSPQLDQGEALESSLLGPAVHLVNMLPPAASLATPSVPLVQAMLTRAQLPLDTIALAVCILDALDSRFARAWRLTCPLGTGGNGQPNRASSPTAATATTAAAVTATATTTATATAASPATTTAAANAQQPPPLPKRHTLPARCTSPSSPFPSFNVVDRLLHIDAVFPEVIILAALVIAAKFTDDGFVSQQPAHAYCSAWGGGDYEPPRSPASAVTACGSFWTAAQLAATERCIMQSLDYRILPLLDPDLLADARADMRRAGAYALRRRKAEAEAGAVAGARPEAAAAATAEAADADDNAHAEATREPVQAMTPPAEDLVAPEAT